ncbi:hypothetical protein LTR72_007616 [Exophiala xenobiotica]|nr:hypothetical protein LTR72_007616 [Exophiala xenobiotica]KAK5336751.1 hypothetical protein LTR98_007057 [Exophiala xenobiotica]
MLAGVELDEWTVVLPTRQNTTLGESLWFGTGHKGKEWVSDLVPEDGTVCSWCGKPEHKGDFTSCTGVLFACEGAPQSTAKGTRNLFSTRTSISRKTRLQQLALAMNLMRLLPSTLLYLLELLLAANFRMLVLQYGASGGCNWNSRIREWIKGERVLWTRLEKPKSNLLIFQRTPVQVRAGTGQGYHRIYIGVRTIPGPSGSFFYFVPKDPNDNSKGGIARIGQHHQSTHLPSTDIVDVTDTPPLGPPGPELTVTSMDQFLATQSAEQQLEHAKNLRAFFVQVAANFDVELISMREILDNITEFMIIQTVDQRQTHIIDLRAYLKKLLADQDPQLADKLFPDVMDEDGVDTDTAVDDEVDDGDEDYDPDNENGQVKSKVTNMLPPPRTFMTSPDDRRLSRQGRQLWMYDYGVARLKDQKMDWLSQTGTIMDFWPLGHIVTAAPMKSDWEMWRDLATLAINAFGTPFQSDRESVRILWPNRACGTSGCDDTKQHTRAF